ncbi:MAG: hypothetical protein K2J61_01090, partial [Clostridia bacterium]|nr:hypothetical protein [Clostridia bacterium]
IVDSRVAVELAISLYEEQLEDYSALEDADKGHITVTNVNASLQVLRAKLAEIEAAEKEAANLAAFNELLAATTAENVTLKSGASLKAAYESLTAAQKNGVSADDKTKYDAIIAKYNELSAQAITCTFIGGNPSNSAFTNVGSKHGAQATEFTVHAYGTTPLASGLKMESGTEVQFVVSQKSEVTFYFNVAGKKSNIVNGDKSTSYSSKENADGDYVITVTLEAGTYKLTKNNTSVALYYATITPVSE